MAPSGLVITADDFGVADEVNAAVEEAHANGVLSAASLMVAAPATARAVEIARRQPTLRVGLHLVLVDGAPALAPDAIPHLVDHDGRLRSDMARAGARIFIDPRARRELAAEIEAQFSAFEATGLRLDHVNVHKHFHLHPTIGGHVLAIGARHGMRAARLPVEPAAALRKVEPQGGAGAPWVSLLASLHRRRFRRAGVTCPDQVFGLAWSGAMTTARLEGLIGDLPSGLTEIYLHPATAHKFAGAAPSYRYREELEALTDPQVRRATAGLRMGGFSDFLCGAERP